MKRDDDGGDDDAAAADDDDDAICKCFIWRGEAPPGRKMAEEGEGGGKEGEEVEEVGEGEEGEEEATSNERWIDAEEGDIGKCLRGEGRDRVGEVE